MSNKTILFADDSATMRAIMEKTFAAEPFDVVAVPSGEAAVATARDIGPAVVIADAGMPGMSGYDVCKALRDEASLKSTPVIIMSGVSSPYDETMGREVGATEHVKKPFDTTKLIERISELTAAASAPTKVAAAPAAPPPKPPTVATPPAPGPAAPAPPIPPAQRPQPQAPAGLVAAGAPKPAIKETMVFGSEAAKEAKPAAPEEVKPIEIATEAPAESEPTFQVGTLAELAQMDDSGKPLAPDVAGKEIELDEPSMPVEPAVVPKAAAAADEVAAAASGLAPEQVEAIRKLTAEVIERVVWEVVPDLAETIIQEKIDKLLEE